MHTPGVMESKSAELTLAVIASEPARVRRTERTVSGDGPPPDTWQTPALQVVRPVHGSPPGQGVPSGSGAPATQRPA